MISAAGHYQYLYLIIVYFGVFFDIVTEAQPGFHFGGGVRALGAGPQVLRAPRFSISTASVGPRYLLRVHERRVIRPLAFGS